MTRAIVATQGRQPAEVAGIRLLRRFTLQDEAKVFDEGKNIPADFFWAVLCVGYRVRSGMPWQGDLPWVGIE